MIALQRVLVLTALALTVAALKVDRASAGQIYVVPLDGSQPPRRVSPEVGRDCGSPYWSPDNERLAYDSWPTEEDFGSSELRVVNADGTGLARFAHGSVPSWSADGKLLAFHAYRPRQRIGVVNADGTGEETLFYDALSPRWVDGRSKIAAVGRGLLVHDAAAGTTTRLTSHPFLRPGFSYTSVSDRFAVVGAFTDRSNRRGYYLLGVPGDYDPVRDGADGKQDLPIWMKTLRRIGQVSWAPDGRRLLVSIGSIDRDGRLVVIDVDGDRKPAPIDAIPEDWIACNANWSPDGEWIAFVRMGEEQDAPPASGDADGP